MSEDAVQPQLLLGELQNLTHAHYTRDVVRDQLAAIDEFIAGHMSAEKCAIELIGTIPKGVAVGSVANEDSDSEDDYDPVYDAVSTLMDNLLYLAIINAQRQHEFVALLQAIKCLPPQTVLVPVPSGKGNDADEIVSKTETIGWGDMPTFSAHLTDTYEYQFFLFTASPLDETVISRWASVNAFIARIASAWDPKYIFYIHRASYRFLRVLDVQNHPHFRGEVSSAANLFRYVSPVLLRLCREEPPMPGVPIGVFAEKPREHDEAETVLWKSAGYSMGRWNWWKVRWGQLAESMKFDEDIQRHAKEALDAMRNAEL